MGRPSTNECDTPAPFLHAGAASRQPPPPTPTPHTPFCCTSKRTTQPPAGTTAPSPKPGRAPKPDCPPRSNRQPPPSIWHALSIPSGGNEKHKGRLQRAHAQHHSPTPRGLSMSKVSKPDAPRLHPGLPPRPRLGTRGPTVRKAAARTHRGTRCKKSAVCSPGPTHVYAMPLLQGLSKASFQRPPFQGLIPRPPFQGLQGLIRTQRPFNKTTKRVSTGLSSHRTLHPFQTMGVAGVLGAALSRAIHGLSHCTNHANVRGRPRLPCQAGRPGGPLPCT